MVSTVERIQRTVILVYSNLSVEHTIIQLAGCIGCALCPRAGVTPPAISPGIPQISYGAQTSRQCPRHGVASYELEEGKSPWPNDR